MYPYVSPAIVEYINTIVMYVIVFLLPSIFLITKRFGKLILGPASSNANAGPLCIPSFMSACNIGISVSVEKYIILPNKALAKFAVIVFVPATLSINPSGISGIKNPTIIIPMNNSGNINFVKCQVSSSHLFLFSFFIVYVVAMIPMIISVSNMNIILFSMLILVIISTAISNPNSVSVFFKGS